MFLLSCRKRGGGVGGEEGGGETEKHKDTLHTHACICISVRTVRLKSEEDEEEEGEEKNPQTQVAPRTHAAVAPRAESGGQIEDQHHLEVTAPHCPVSV